MSHDADKLKSEIKESIRNGNHATEAIWHEVSVKKTDDDGNVETDSRGNAKRTPSRSLVNRRLNEMLEADVLVRERDGRGWEYFIAEEKKREQQQDWNADEADANPAPADVAAQAPQGVTQPAAPAATAGPGIGNMPVSRDYDFSEKVPENIPPYIPSGDELAQLLASIQTRTESGKLPRYLIGGPTGCGKTHLVKYLAQYLDVPLFTIQGKWALNEADLLGQPVMVNDTSWWVDGELTKAIIASQDQTVILLIDEINRAREDSKGVLYPALDDRCEVRLDMRGGEVVSGDPRNLIAFGTLNEGNGYFTQGMDLAEIRRMATEHDVDYLGKTHPEREADLIAERTPAGEGLAALMVETANLVRVMADKPNNIELGIPTASLISWAREAYAYNERDMANPVFEAAKATVIRPYYKENPEVQETISGKFDGAPFADDDFENWKGMDIHTYVKQVRKEREEEEQAV